MSLKFFNPADPYNSFGISPARSVWQRIQLLRQELSSWQSVLTNMAFPSALVSPPEGEVWNDLQTERVAKQSEERFRYGNQGGVWVVQEALDYTPISTPPKDLSALQLYDQLKTCICNAYHIPRTLLDMSDNAFAAVQTARRSFQLDCLKPRAINLVETITRFLCPDRLFLATDEIVEPDQTFELQRTSALWQASLITQNEARSTQGLDPVAGGEKFLYQLLGSGGNSGMGTLPSFQGEKSTKGFKFNNDPADGRPLAEVLQRVFRQFAKQYTEKTTGTLTMKKLIPFEDWTKEMIDAITPVLKLYFEDGSRNVIDSLGGELGLKNLPVLSLDKAVNRAALALADSTLRTTEMSISEATEATREAIRTGLNEGEANIQLADRIKNIFTDLSERRCYLIADTESNRSKHEGEILTIQENGLSAKKVWLCDNMACPLCKTLNGEAVDLDTPFHVDSKGGPYAVTNAPPRHPACRCNLQYDILTGGEQ